MSEHLAIVSPRTLRGFVRTRTMTWVRRRREAPIGRVRAGDLVFVKTPGGLVVARGTVAKARETRKGGRYVLALRFRGVQKLPVPFPVVKRDRRSWVVCAPATDPAQQALIARSPLGVTEVIRAIRGSRRLNRSPRSVENLLAAYARAGTRDRSLLLWLAFLASAREEDVVERLREYLRRPPSRVAPFAVFS